MAAVSITAPNREGVSLLDIAREVAAMARAALPPMWIEWKRLNGFHPVEPASYGVCVPTSFALRNALRRAVPEVRWDVVGGRPTKRTPRGGFLSRDGKANPHVWVVGRGSEGVAVIDITADQFGCEPVVAMLSGRSYKANATRRLLQRYEAHELVTAEMFTMAIDHAFRRTTAA